MLVPSGALDSIAMVALESGHFLSIFVAGIME